MKDEDVRANGFKRDRLEPNYFGPSIGQLSTADLIAELERRRPDCNKCSAKGKPCVNCIWCKHWRKCPNYNDNFKPSSERGE